MTKWLIYISPWSPWGPEIAGGIVGLVLVSIVIGIDLYRKFG